MDEEKRQHDPTSHKYPSGERRHFTPIATVVLVPSRCQCRDKSSRRISTGNEGSLTSRRIAEPESFNLDCLVGRVLSRLVSGRSNGAGTDAMTARFLSRRWTRFAVLAALCTVARAAHAGDELAPARSAG